MFHVRRDRDYFSYFECLKEHEWTTGPQIAARIAVYLQWTIIPSSYDDRVGNFRADLTTIIRDPCYYS